MGRLRRGTVGVTRWLLGLVCLTGLGCSVNVDWGTVRKPQPAPNPMTGQGMPQGQNPIQPVSHTTPAGDPLMRPEPLTMPQPMPNTTLMPMAAPMPNKLVSDVKPMPDAKNGGNGHGNGGCPGCDANVAVHPSMQHAYNDTPGGFPPMGYNPLPTELAKKTHPAYIIEPPDILLIDAGRLVPRPPYVIQPLDQLVLQATETFPGQPINGLIIVGPDGTVALGFGYGTVRVAGRTLEQAQTAIRTQLEKTLKNPQVSLGLASLQSVQQVRGEHLVRADGTISLGVYGCVYIAGMSLCQAQTVIDAHLSQFFQDPEITIDVFAYNSKAYYVVVDGGGYGMQVVKFPITGNETVLDAINNIGGLPAVASRRRIWVARPTPANHECVQILPVDWLAIVQSGSTRTNYQLFPGDRVYIKADPLISLDNTLAKIISPIERIFGVTLLGTSVVNSIRQGGQNGGGGVGFVTGF